MAASSSKQKIEDAVQTKLESTISHAEKEPPETSTQKAKHLSPYTAYVKFSFAFNFKFFITIISLFENYD